MRLIFTRAKLSRETILHTGIIFGSSVLSFASLAFVINNNTIQKKQGYPLVK